ncbi:MAG: transposase [Planctomycetia bacterium]|nr:transposase [Planctomycetia bacterium]
MSVATVSDVVPIGVGFDTARYGHHVSFLRPDLQPAAPHFTFPESQQGYQQLHQALEHLFARHEGRVHFHVRVDAAGQYAANLERFLRGLPYPLTFSVGQPMRNKEYRKAHFPKRKSDAVESLACARFAIVERPAPTPPTPEQWQILRELISRLQAKVKQATRLINQLHNRRGPCPIHGGFGRGQDHGDAGLRCRSFSVNLQRNVFQCFHPPCGAHGNVLDLWAAIRKLPLRACGAGPENDLQLVTSSTEKRNP